MNIRQGVFLIGETVNISGYFRNIAGEPINDVTGARIYIRRPKTVLETAIPLISVNGFFVIDVSADKAGTWKVRVECDSPNQAAREKFFEVVASKVLPAPV